MENEGNVKEIKINKRTKFRMALKFLRMYFYKTIKRRWYLPSVSEINVDELYDLINSDQSPFLIDVTEPRFYQIEKEKPEKEQNELVKLSAKKIPNAKMIPILELSSNLKDLQSFMESVTDLEDLQSFKEKEIVTICPGGGMSLIAVDVMVEVGFKNVKSLTGGFELWVEKGYPTSNISENIS
ncbi:MAG: rhodanese-like domain-containing protein [Candidatus Hodarchaeales archaeon]